MRLIAAVLIAATVCAWPSTGDAGDAPPRVVFGPGHAGGAPLRVVLRPAEGRGAGHRAVVTRPSESPRVRVVVPRTHRPRPEIDRTRTAWIRSRDERVRTPRVAAPRVGRAPTAATRPRVAYLVHPARIRVQDGDTFYVGGDTIRLRGIDTPELGGAWSAQATWRLTTLLRAGWVTIVPHAEDVYGRTVADVFVNGRSVAEILRREGYAKPRTRTGRA